MRQIITGETLKRPNLGKHRKEVILMSSTTDVNEPMLEVSDEVQALLERTDGELGPESTEFNETAERYEIVFGRSYSQRPQ